MFCINCSTSQYKFIWHLTQIKTLSSWNRAYVKNNSYTELLQKKIQKVQINVYDGISFKSPDISNAINLQ